MKEEVRTCKNCAQTWIVDEDDFSFYTKMGVPAPILCPQCRFRRRALFRNEITLYQRTCDLCKKAIISCYNPNSSYTIYCEKCYESDTWDPYSFGREFDPERPFFEQLGELMRATPKKAMTISNASKLGPNINSDYTNYAGGNKDSYLVFNCGGNENVHYSRGASFSRDTLDAYFGLNLEQCYEAINVNQSSGVQFGQNVVGSLDSLFVMDVSGCQHCFGCVNLRHKSYQFLNEPLSKQEYEKRVKEIRGSYQKTEEFKKHFAEFSLKFPRRANSNLKSTNCTGDYLFESKNMKESFETSKCEDGKYHFSVKFNRDSYDILGHGYDSELLLETVATGYSNRIIGGFWVENSESIEYSAFMRSAKECLGCDGLRNAKHCILNKKYSEEEYNKLRERIIEELKKIGEYGLMMPPKLAPFGYNETVGQENLPLTREEAIKLGLPWQDNMLMTKGKETMGAAEIPDHIRDVKDDITHAILACISCARNYRITPAELQLYRKLLLPIPRACFYCRHADRIRRRGPITLFDRTCDHCKKPIKTSYASNRPEIVYCEECYQREVV